jgi:hypothetical protein
MIVPMLILGLVLRLKTAVATSLVIVLFTSAVSAAVYVGTGFRSWCRWSSGPCWEVGSARTFATVPRTPAPDRVRSLHGRRGVPALDRRHEHVLETGSETAPCGVRYSNQSFSLSQGYWRSRAMTSRCSTIAF